MISGQHFDKWVISLIADTEIKSIPTMDVDSDNESPSASSSLAVKDKKRFEVKKWNAVALWAWDIVVDNCAICRLIFLC